MSKFQQNVMQQVLDDAEISLRVGNMQRAMHVIFVWSQRKQFLLAGEETWADQQIGEVLPQNYALPDFMTGREPRPSLNDVLDDHVDAPRLEVVRPAAEVAAEAGLPPLESDESWVAAAKPQRGL